MSDWEQFAIWSFKSVGELGNFTCTLELIIRKKITCTIAVGHWPVAVEITESNFSLANNSLKLPDSVANPSYNKYTKSNLKIYQIWNQLHIYNKTYNLTLFLMPFYCFMQIINSYVVYCHHWRCCKLNFYFLSLDSGAWLRRFDGVPESLKPIFCVEQ